MVMPCLCAGSVASLCRFSMEVLSFQIEKAPTDGLVIKCAVLLRESEWIKASMASSILVVKANL